jgi:hypothetical protein
MRREIVGQAVQPYGPRSQHSGRAPVAADQDDRQRRAGGGAFEALYSHLGRPSVPPERLLRGLLLQAFYSIRSRRLLMEQLDYNLLYRWFAGGAMIRAQPGTGQPPRQRRGDGAGCKAR